MDRVLKITLKVIKFNFEIPVYTLIYLLKLFVVNIYDQSFRYRGFGTVRGEILSWFSVTHNLICAHCFICDLFFFSPFRATGASGLALLVAQMQKNADTVEKDILRSEELLAVVRTQTERQIQTNSQLTKK